MNVKEALLKTLADAGEEYISGAALAESLGVSRNAVWKAANALKEEGYSIESSTPKGYRLAAGNNRLSAEVISSKLNTEALGRTLEVLDEVESTNDAAKEKAGAGAPHGTVVIADRQTAGKGRLGRSFESPAGVGVYLSVIVRPELKAEDAALMTSAAAVAVAQAVESFGAKNARIKWVNDVYLGDKKICGVLTEASFGLETKSLDYAVVGIGINVRSVKGLFDEELGERATSIEDETGLKIDRNELCAVLLDKLEYWLSRVEKRDFLIEYRRREYLTGKRVTVTVGGKTMTGSAVGVDNNANLMIELPSGEIRKINSGEAELCRPKK